MNGNFELSTDCLVPFSWQNDQTLCRSDVITQKKPEKARMLKWLL